jgi:DNA-binding FrmR family transcriptional regulator
MRKAVLNRLIAVRDALQGHVDELTNIAETATLKDDEHTTIDESIDRTSEAINKLNELVEIG